MAASGLINATRLHEEDVSHPHPPHLMAARRTRKQMEHARNSMNAINMQKTAQRRATPGSSSQQENARDISELTQKVKATTTKLVEVTRKLKNRSMEAYRAKNSIRNLRDLNRHLKDAMRKRKEREPKKQERAVRKVLQNLNKEPDTRYLKSKNVIIEESREMIRDLSMVNVPDNSVNTVIHIVGKWLGVDVKDAISERSVARIVQEGGIAAKLQLVDEITQAEGSTTVTYHDL
jgi:small-conductance mechanosensitive channel